MSYCSSPLFFCFSVLSLYSLVSSSLPLSVRLPCFQNNLSSSLKQSPASFSLFGSLLQVRFPQILPLWFPFFLFLPSHIRPLFLLQNFAPLFLVSSPLVFIGKRRESPHCLVPSCMAHEGNRVTLPLQGKVAGCLQGMVPLSWQGIVVWVWVLAGFYASGRERK